MSSPLPADTSLPTAVVPGVYLGDKRLAANKDVLHALGITHIVNVTHDVRHYFESELHAFTYLRCACHDTDTAELYLHFAPACHFIHSALAAGHAALIHCQQGISRSAAIATAYLIRHHDQSLRDAYVQVKASRPAVKVSANFLRQLMRWERQCRDEPKQAAQRKSSTAQQAETAKSQPEPAVQMEYAVETNKRKRATEAESVQAEQAAERESSEAKETEKTRDADTDGVAASADVAKREQGVSSGKRQKVAELSLLNLQHEHQPKPTTQRLLERSTHTSDGV